MNKNSLKDVPILGIIQKLKDRLIKPDVLDKETRQDCVEVLAGEGYSVIQIAQIMDKAERTIRRDLEDIRQKNALSPNIDLAKKLIGEMVAKARLCQSHVMRLARSNSSTVAEKTQAEYTAWKIQKELIEKMQTLGYLPLKPQEVIGDFYHHMSEENSSDSLEESKKMIVEIQRITQETETLTPEIEKEIKQLTKRIEKAEIHKDVNTLLNKKKEESNE